MATLKKRDERDTRAKSTERWRDKTGSTKANDNNTQERKEDQRGFVASTDRHTEGREAEREAVKQHIEEREQTPPSAILFCQ